MLAVRRAVGSSSRGVVVQARALHRTPIARKSASAVVQAPNAYSTFHSFLHWTMAGGFVSCAGLIQYKNQLSKEDKKKYAGQIMFWHKSCGLLMLAALMPRLLIRATTRMPAPLAGNSLEQIAGKVSHFAWYAVMITMPTTGFLMGYFNGRGLPFFFTTIPSNFAGGEKNGALAGQAFNIHQTTGQFFEYVLLPAHIGGAAFHMIKGQPILARMGIGSMPKPAA